MAQKRKESNFIWKNNYQGEIMDKPLVSIVLPTYNGEKYLKEALDAIMDQTYTNWELIIVNDCSTDSTPQIIQEYINKDKRIRTVNNEVNKKVPASLNIGFSQARGEYYTWTSDDNYYYPDALEKMVEFLEHNKDYGMVYAVCDLLNAAPDVPNVWGEVPSTVEELLNFNVCGACFLYRASVAKDVGEYRKDLHLADDHDYCLRIKLKYNIANLEDHLYAYRLHPGSLTSSYQDKSRLLGIKIAVDMMDKFLAKYPESKEYIENEMTIRKALIYKDEVLLAKLLKEKDKKLLYNELKYFYQLTEDNFYIDCMKKIGGKYFIKGLLREMKIKRRSFFGLDIRRYGDDRGFLTTIENSEIPFKIKRVYYISEVSKDKDRAHHAHKRSQRILSCIQGSVEVSLFDGKNKKTFLLDNPKKAVYFNKKVWCELSNFKDNAIVLALASEGYDEKEYIRNYYEYLKFIKGDK